MFHQPHNSMGNYHYNGIVYQAYRWASHFHRSYELVYGMAGQTKIGANGQELLLGEGEFYLIFPNTVHSLESVDGSRFWVGVFSGDFIGRFAKAEEGQCYSPFRCEPEVERFLKGYLLFDGTPSLDMRIACLNLVCDQCLKYGEKQEICYNPDLKNKLLLYFADHFKENVTLSEIAGELGYEYHYLSREFHRCFQMNFKTFLNLYRFEAACELLSETEKSLTEIAMESGFQSLRSFNRLFKDFSGMAPHQYRRK